MRRASANPHYTNLHLISRKGYFDRAALDGKPQRRLSSAISAAREQGWQQIGPGVRSCASCGPTAKVTA
jgi:hypothetical protein